MCDKSAKKGNKKKWAFMYVAGSIILTAVSFVAMPKIIDHISSKIFNSRLIADIEEGAPESKIVKKK